MPNIGDTITLDLPTVQSTVGPDYATDINQALTDLKDILEQKIPLSSLSVTQDLSMRGGASYYSVTDVDALELIGRTASTTLLANGSVYRTGAELQFKDGAGNIVPLTLNGAAIGDTATNGITSTGSPAYNASGQVIEWDGTNSYYSLYKAASDWANARVGELWLTGDNTYFTKLVSNSGLSADLTITLPEAGAGANEVLGISSSGAITSGNAFNAFSMVSGQDITYVGAGRSKGTSRDYNVGAASGYAEDADAANFSKSTFTVIIDTAGVGVTWLVPLHIEDNAKISEFWVEVTKSSTTAMTVELLEVDNAGAHTIEDTSSSTSSGKLTLGSSGLALTKTAGYTWVAAITGGDNTDIIYAVRAKYTDV